MRYLTIITMLLFGSLRPMRAQETILLSEALKQCESHFDVKFAYDPAVINNISGSFQHSTLDSFITQLETNLPLKIDKIGDAYYTLTTVLSTFSIELTDSLANARIEPPFFVLLNSDPLTVHIEKGVAFFDYKPSLQDTLMVYVPGYEKLQLPIAQLLNQRKLVVPMLTQTYWLNNVIIEDYITKGINMNPSQQKISIKTKDLPLLPGETDGDIFASLAALPGITTPDGRPGNLFIRGTSADQSLILFDNIPIYHRGHYYGTISPYNPKVVDQVDVYRSGYHPRLGGRVGGAVLIHSGKEVNSQPQYGVGLNTLFGMAYGKTPLANNTIGLVFGARHSYPSIIKSPKLNAISESVFSGTGLVDENGNIVADIEVSFEDYHTKLIFHPGIKSTMSVSGIYSRSNLNTLLNAGLTAGDPERFDFKNYGVNAEWNYHFNQNWEMAWINTGSHYSYTNTTSRGPIGQRAINRLKDFNSRLEWSRSVANQIALQSGLDYKYQSTGIEYLNSGEVSNTLININQTVVAHSLSPYANLEWFGSDRLYLQLGLRGTYYSPTGSFNAAPRASVNYAAQPWITLKGTIGTYYQYLSQVKNLEFGGGGFDNELWMLAGKEQGDVISGEQLMLGTLIHNNCWLLDVEAYFKTAKNITYYTGRRFDTNHTYFTADDQLYGVDAYLKKDLGAYTSSWIGYSYGHSKIELDTTSLQTYESKNMQPHLVYLGIGFQKNRWKLSALWKYSSGLNAQSLDIIHAKVIFERAQANPAPGAPRPANPFANLPDRYANIHTLNISASYKIPKMEKRKWSASFGLSIINTLDQPNLIDRVFRRSTETQPGFVDRYALGFAPNLMVLIEW